jgi:hypothetical protein
MTKPLPGYRKATVDGVFISATYHDAPLPSPPRDRESLVLLRRHLIGALREVDELLDRPQTIPERDR